MALDIDDRLLIAADLDPKDKTDRETTPGRMLDLMVLCLAIDAYKTLGTDSDFLNKGLTLYRMHRDSIEQASAKHIETLMDRSDAGVLKSKYRLMDQVDPSKKAKFIEELMVWLKHRSTLMRDVFPGRIYSNATKVAVAAAEDDILVRIQKLAIVPTSSGLSTMFKWVRKTAELLGSPPSTFEAVAAQSDGARGIARDLTEVSRKLDVEPKDSPIRTALEDQKLDLTADLNEAVSDSDDPLTVMSAATADLNATSKVSQKFGLNSEQEDAMFARGKVVVAAGAGSGKTRTLVATIANLVEEQGYQPSQILACSFTNAAASELELRVEKAGINGVKIGTTHSIACDLIRRNRPDLAKAVTNVKAADFLFKMAMKQVPLDLETYQKGLEQSKGMLARIEAIPGWARDSFLVSIRDQVIRGRNLSPNQIAVVERRETGGARQDLPVPVAEGGAGAPEEGPSPTEVLMGRIERIRNWRNFNILVSLHDQLSRGRSLSPKQLAVIDKFDHGGRQYSAAEQPMVDAVRLAVAAAMPPQPVTAADFDSEPPDSESGEGSESKKSPYWKIPVGQWFNLGKPILDNEGKPMGERRAKLVIDNFKNSDKTVEDIRSELGDGNTLCALYAAYEWLKKNDPVMAPALDFTDQLVVARDLLRDNPSIKDSEQRRYKAVMVDEAQDLNQIQFEMFSMLGAKTDLYGCIGDDKQCVAIDTPILLTHQGITKLAQDLKPDEQILSYRNGRFAPQVCQVTTSSWTWGYKITTKYGHSLTMSPNHKIWATQPTLQDGQLAVYLMYRSDMGYRIGITNKCYDEDYYNSFGGRAFLEKAERMWVLEICPDREAALLRELWLSLKYGVPTMVFLGEHRGLNQDRINSIFSEFGENGRKILEDRHLNFDLPHWMSRSYSKHGRTRRTIQMIAHSASNSQVAMEWMGDDLDEKLASIEVVPQHSNKGTKRIRRWFQSYRAALSFAEMLQKTTGANLCRRLSTPDGAVGLLTASAILQGMQVICMSAEDRDLVLDEVISVEKVEGVEFVDIDVDDASNFFGGGILSHNSIYGFRGAKPSNYVGLSRSEGVQTKIMKMNFRSGKAIVDSANKLIAHNEDRQIEMVCDADEERKGQGSIRARQVASHEDAADQAAQEIKDAVDAGDSPRDFGILVRNNAEADAYTLSLLVRGIPYRMLKKSEGGYFGRPLVKALTAWMRLVIGGSRAEVNDAVLDAHMTPGFGMDRQFSAHLGRNARGESFLEYILADKPVYSGEAAWMNKRVREYSDKIREIQIQGGMDSPSLIRAILGIKGSKGTFEEALLKLVDEEDVLEDESGESSEEAMRNAAMAPLRPLMVMAENFKDPENLLLFVGKMKAANEKAQKKTPHDKDDWKEPAVLVGTVHGWKGLEAKHTFISMAGGIFPNFRTDKLAMDDPTAYDEERRLAYVAITRGEQSVTVMSPSMNYLGKPAQLSRFVSEACIPIAGEPDEEVGAEPNIKQVTVSDPSQVEQDLKLASADLPGLFPDLFPGSKKPTKSGSFGESLALFGTTHLSSFDEDEDDEDSGMSLDKESGCNNPDCMCEGSCTCGGQCTFQSTGECTCKTGGKAAMHVANSVEELATQLQNDLTGVQDYHDTVVAQTEAQIRANVQAPQVKLSDDEIIDELLGNFGVPR